jgi:hypothetical protein
MLPRASWALACTQSLHGRVTSVLLHCGGNLDDKTVLRLMVSKAELEVLLDRLQTPRPREKAFRLHA